MAAKNNAARKKKAGGHTSIVQYRDVVKSAAGSRLLAILGIENQSSFDPSMPYRVTELDFVNYARQVQMIREKHRKEWTDEDGHIHKPADISDEEYMAMFLKTDRLLKCVTLVVYWDDEPWDGPTKLSDLFAGGMDGDHTIQMKLNLLDVCRMTDDEILSYTSELRTVFGFKKYAKDKEKLRAFIDNNKEYFSSVSDTALNALDELTHSPELQKIRVPRYQTEGGFNVCLGIKEMIQDSKMEGKKEMALSLAQMGLSPEKIAEAAKVSVSLVQEWIAGSVGPAK